MFRQVPASCDEAMGRRGEEEYNVVITDMQAQFVRFKGTSRHLQKLSLSNLAGNNTIIASVSHNKEAYFCSVCWQRYEIWVSYN